MSRVYSTQFYANEIPQLVTTDLFTCPAGHVYVIKSILYGQWGGPVGEKLALGSVGVVNTAILTATSSANFVIAQAERWAVMKAGDIMRATPNNGKWRLWISGYDLIA